MSTGRVRHQRSGRLGTIVSGPHPNDGDPLPDEWTEALGQRLRPPLPGSHFLVEPDERLSWEPLDRPLYWDTGMVDER